MASNAFLGKKKKKLFQSQDGEIYSLSMFLEQIYIQTFVLKFFLYSLIIKWIKLICETKSVKPSPIVIRKRICEFK